MDVKRGRAVVAQYRSLLSAMPKGSGPFDRDPTPREAFSHLAGMLDQMVEFLDKADTPYRTAEEQLEWDKFNRWLGFMQGVFWLHGDYTLNQMRDHNRTRPEKGTGARPPKRFEDWVGKTPAEIEELERNR